MIDADSVLYAAALRAECVVKGRGGDPDEYFIVKEPNELYRDVVEKLEGLVQEVKAEDALICLTPTGKSFRYALLPSYKANRATLRRPTCLRPLQEMVADRKPFRTLAVWGLEADDVCGIAQTSLQRVGLREPVIVSIDKDMQQIPGLNYSPMAAARNGTIGEVLEVTGFDGDRMHLYQTLVGDVVDNYTGCPGIGAVKANRILEECVETQGELDWRWVIEAFRKKGLNEEYALTQARVARILRDTDWNPKHKEVKLWSPGAYSQCSPEEKPSLTASAVQASTPSPTESMILAAPTRIILDERKGATLH